MDSQQLHGWQLAKMKQDLSFAFRYLHRMIQRMERTNFPVDDPLFRATRQAYDGIHSVTIHLHYLECDACQRERDARTSRPGNKTAHHSPPSSSVERLT